MQAYMNETQERVEASENVWLNELLQNRRIIESMREENQELRQELHSLRFDWSLLREFCVEIGYHEFIAAKSKELAHVRVAQAPIEASMQNSPGNSPKKIVDAFICGSPSFQEYVAICSYEESLARKQFHRRNVLELEEAQLRGRYDIFGNPKTQSPLHSPISRPSNEDTMDQLMSSGMLSPSFKLPSAR